MIYLLDDNFKLSLSGEMKPLCDKCRDFAIIPRLAYYLGHDDICSQCGRKIVRSIEDFGGIPASRRTFSCFEFSVNYLFPIATGIETGWKMGAVCEECSNKLKRILIESGIKIVEIDNHW